MTAEALCWPPGYAPHCLDGQTVQVRAGAWRGESYTLTGGDLLLRVVRLVDNRRTAGQVLDQLPPGERQAAAGMLERLSEAGLLTGRAAPGQPGPPDAVHDYLTILPPHSGGAEALAAARCLVIGGGVLGSRVALGLAQLGIGTVNVADGRRVEPEDSRINLAYMSARPGARRGPHLARMIRRIAPEVKAAAVSVRSSRSAALAAVMREHDMVICAEDRPDPALWDALNRVSLATGTPWSVLTSDGLQAFIGPTFYPGQTACAHCWEHAAASDLSQAERQALRRFQAHQPDSPLYRFIGLGAMADIAAGFLTADVLRLITRTGGLTAGRGLTLDFVTLGCELSDVPRDPRCPVCRAWGGRPFGDGAF